MAEKDTRRVQPRKWQLKNKLEIRKENLVNPVAGFTAIDFLQFYTLVDSLGIEFVVDEEQAGHPLIGLQSLGIGGSFKVQRAFHPQDRSDLVLKSAIADPRLFSMKSLITELRVMSHPPLRSQPNITNLLGLTWYCDEFYEIPVLPIVVMEYSPLGTLTNFLIKQNASIAIKKQLCLDVANGLNALHRCRILHSDVKSENVLVFKSEDGGFLAKVSDFGSSLPDCEDGSLRCRISITKPWNAPETENGRELNYQNMWKTDIFSYGMLCWRTILESKCYPFTIPEASQSQTIQKLKKEGKLIETAAIGIRGLNALDEAAHLLQILDCTLQLDPHKRIGTF